MIFLFTFIPEKNLEKLKILSYTWPDVEYKTFKVVRYDYFIWIDSVKNAQNLRPILNAYNKITFRAIDPTDSIYLHFIKGYYIVPYWTDTVKNNLIIDSVKFFHNSNYISGFIYSTPGDTLIIVKFPYTINPNDSFRVEIYYHGITNRSGSSFGGGLDLKQNDIVYADNEPFGLRRWLPSFDLPYEKPQIVDAKIKTKLGWKTIANGKLIDSLIEGPWITYHYRESYPIAPYLIVFASSNQFTIQTQTWNYNFISMPIYHYLGPSNNNPSLYLPNQLTIFSNKYGIYPFYDEKYAEVQIFQGFFGGAMENQTNTFTIATNYELLSAHELAHHWWGDMVTCATFKDIFINESFATYSEAVYDEDNLGYGDYSGRGYMGQIHGDINRYLNYGDYNKPIYNPGPSLGDVFDGNITYSKGSAVLHALRLLFRVIYSDSALGDSKFFEALRYYGNKRKFSYARIIDFENDIKEFLNNENRDTSIGYFFNQWIFKPGHPQFQFLISKYFNGSTYDFYIKVNQNQPSTWSKFRIPKYPIRIKFSDNTQIDTTINIDSLLTQTFYFNFTKEPTTIIPDYPNHYIDQTSIALIPENEFIYVKIKDNKLKLSIPIYGNYDIKIYNSLGRIVFSKNLQSNKSQIELLLNLPKGIYFIEIKGSLNYKSKIINF